MLDVAIIYEHKNREMESVLLLKYELMRRGYSVELIQTVGIGRWRHLLKKPRLLVVPFLYGEYELYSYGFDLVGNVPKVLNLQWEQVYSGDLEEYPTMPDGTMKEAVHICWGSKICRAMKAHGCRNAFPAGALSMDFLKPAFRSWYMGRDSLYRRYGIDPRNKTLLFISSFSYIGLSQEILEHFQSLCTFDTFWFKDISIQTRDIVLSWFERLLTEQKDINIIYRPHPGELIDDKIKELCKRHKNLFCIPDLPIKQWITAADITLNWYSTAGVECFFAGKKDLFLRPLELGEDMEYKMFANACTVRDYETFRDHVVFPEKIDEWYAEHPLDRGISEYYTFDGGYTYKKICDLIEKMLRTKKYDMPRIKYSTARRLKNTLIAEIKNAVYLGYKHRLPLFGVLAKKSKKAQAFINEGEEFYTERITPKEERRAARKLKTILDKID